MPPDVLGQAIARAFELRAFGLAMDLLEARPGTVPLRVVATAAVDALAGESPELFVRVVHYASSRQVRVPAPAAADEEGAQVFEAEPELVGGLLGPALWLPGRAGVEAGLGLLSMRHAKALASAAQGLALVRSDWPSLLAQAGELGCVHMASLASGASGLGSRRGDALTARPVLGGPASFCAAARDLDLVQCGGVLRDVPAPVDDVYGASCGVAVLAACTHALQCPRCAPCSRGKTPSGAAPRSSSSRCAICSAWTRPSWPAVPGLRLVRVCARGQGAR
jgi:hypothetical protein